MDFPPGQRVSPPSGADSSWYGKALIQLRREAAGDVELRIETADGAEVVGYLDQISSVLGRSYIVRLDDGERIRCEDIKAITVLGMS